MLRILNPLSWQERGLLDPLDPGRRIELGTIPTGATGPSGAIITCYFSFIKLVGNLYFL